MTKKTPMELAREMERFTLTKPEIVEILDGITDRWRKNKKANAKYIFAMGLFKIGLLAMREEEVVGIFHEINKTFNDIYATSFYKMMDGEIDAPQLKKLWFEKMRAERANAEKA